MQANCLRSGGGCEHALLTVHPSPPGFVFTSGGIGPTHDDVTYESLASAFGACTFPQLRLSLLQPPPALLQLGRSLCTCAPLLGPVFTSRLRPSLGQSGWLIEFAKVRLIICQAFQPFQPRPIACLTHLLWPHGLPSSLPGV